MKPKTTLTRADFPIDVPVQIEAMIDGNCGWEYDAPLHFMVPFHHYRIVSASGGDVIRDELEELLGSMVDCDNAKHLDDSEWPYGTKRRLRDRFNAAKADKKESPAYYVATVTVHDWDELQWTITVDGEEYV